VSKVTEENSFAHRATVLSYTNMAQQQSLSLHTGSPEPNRSKGWSHATEDGPSNALLLFNKLAIRVKSVRLMSNKLGKQFIPFTYIK
jgi:hypothetical protein